jgi:hypothetical protein
MDGNPRRITPGENECRKLIKLQMNVSVRVLIETAHGGFIITLDMRCKSKNFMMMNVLQIFG